MEATLVFLIAASLGHHHDDPRIVFRLNTGTVATHGKVAYQGDFKYVVLLDQYGRPCPTGRFATRQPESLGGGLEQDRNLFSISVLPPTPGYFLFCSGRLVYFTHISGEGGSRIYAPDLIRKIISIDTYLESTEVFLKDVSNYREIYKQPRTTTPQQRHIFLLPGYLSAVNEKYVRTSAFRNIADYPKQPPAFIESKPDNAQKHTFLPDYSQRYAIRFHQLIYTVTIDKDSGEYLFEDFAKKINAADQPRPELPPWLYQPKLKDESVYELKYGRLIPGFLAQIGEEEWLFVPDLGGTIIEAKEYLKTYQPWSRRIYNLPGKFVLPSGK